MKSRRTRRSLRRIQRIALDPKGNLETALGLCLLLGGQTGSAKLRAWANQELQGYPDGADLPHYRKVPGPLYLDGSTGGGYVFHQLITPGVLPGIPLDLMSDPALVSEPLSALRASVAHARKRGEDTLSYAPAAVGILLQLANGALSKSGSSRKRVDRIYWSVSLATLEGIQSAVRANLLMLATAIDSATHTATTRSIPEQIDTLVTRTVFDGDTRDVTIVNAGPHSKVTIGSKEGRIAVGVGITAAITTIAYSVMHW